MLRRRLYCLLIAILFLQILPVTAHANLVRSEPPANSRVDVAPAELRLYFTEPLEASFSKIEIRNSQSEVLDLPPASVSGNDAKILILPIDSLPDAIYTVVWSVVSQTDGHPTQGSFPLTIGVAKSRQLASVGDVEESIPIASSIIRWLNLLSLAWFVGAIGFWVFVWFPSVPDGNPDIEKPMRRQIWVAWECVGVASSLVLLLQSQIVSNSDWQALLNTIPQILITTRFGDLWLARMTLWIISGLVLWRNPHITLRTASLLLGIGAIILMTQSLFSHASGAIDAIPTVLADWLHLLAMSIWVGGFLQFIIVIPRIRVLMGYLAIMVANFSNMARLSVAMLIITGTYAAWLHIGSLDALLTTPYGQAMIVKLILFMSLLLIGAVNLFLTYRGLRNGQKVWSTRLQYLVMAEIILAIGILGAVGIMTAISPARITLAVRQAVSLEPEISSFFEMVEEDNMMIHFSVEPGYVGENTFEIDLYDEETLDSIADASLIRLRFESESDNLGESELRPESLDDGRYIVSGSNLSIAGDWRIRMTIQRPNEFDTVVDFEPTITIAPQQDKSGGDPIPSEQHRGVALIVTGIMGVLTGGILLFKQRPMTIVALMLTIVFIGVSIVILLSGL